MCESCGCGDPENVPVEVHDKILSDNDRIATHNREHFARAGITAVNLMGSPGSGKTSLLEATARHFAQATAKEGDGSSASGAPRRSKGPESPRLAALSGDLATDNDADRLRACGIPSASITTGSACHLDARLVHHALHDAPWHETDYLFIENVGNLVCPAIYDLGEAANVVCLSVTEGEDKPLKYPVMFRKADLVVLTKTDLLPHLGSYSLERVEDALGRVMPEPRMLHVSATSGEGLAHWVDWLERLRTSPAIQAGRDDRAAHASRG
jgi:hydrogenase nickel incorporation protein HypB